VIRAVLDANTLASGSLSSQGSIARLIDSFLAEEFRVFLSAHILRELERALAKPYFANRLNPQWLADYLAIVRSTATMVDITVEVHGVATHPEDDLVLATALTAGVSHLVTGDSHLQHLGTYQNVVITSSRQFLDLLRGAGGTTV
jgi:putative PIN family toxin of toxin-antitoxin system